MHEARRAENWDACEARGLDSVRVNWFRARPRTSVLATAPDSPRASWNAQLARSCPRVLSFPTHGVGGSGEMRVSEKVCCGSAGQGRLLDSAEDLRIYLWVR